MNVATMIRRKRQKINHILNKYERSSRERRRNKDQVETTLVTMKNTGTAGDTVPNAALIYERYSLPHAIQRHKLAGMVKLLTKWGYDLPSSEKRGIKKKL